MDSDVNTPLAGQPIMPPPQMTEIQLPASASALFRDARRLRLDCRARWRSALSIDFLVTMTDTVIYFALVGLASATDADTSVAAAAWQDYLTVRNVLIACFVLYRLYSSLGGGGSPETKAFSEKFLAENKVKEGVVTLASGLQYKVLRSGHGDSHPLPNSPCACHYEGRCAKDWPDGKKFDSSYDRGSPTTFAPNQVIKGWTVSETAFACAPTAFARRETCRAALPKLPACAQEHGRQRPSAACDQRIACAYVRLRALPVAGGDAADGGGRQMGDVHPSRPGLRRQWPSPRLPGFHHGDHQDQGRLEAKGEKG